MVPPNGRLPDFSVTLAVIGVAGFLVMAVMEETALAQAAEPDGSTAQGGTLLAAGQSLLSDTIAPLPPPLVAPLNGSKTNKSKPAFVWAMPADSGGSGLKNYRIHIDDEPAFAAPRVKEYTATGLSYSPTLYQGHFYWRVYARDNAGNQSAWSPTWELVIDLAAPTSVCTSLVCTNHSPIAVTWQANDAGGAGVAWVKLYFQCEGETGWRHGAQDSAAGSSGRFDFVSSQGDGIYRFKTISVDSAGNAEAGPTGRGDDSTLFDTTPPSVSTLLRPLHESWTMDTVIVFAWACALDPDPGSGVRQYFIQIDDEPSFVAPFMISDSASDTSATFPIPEEDVCWRIAAQDMAGNTSAWSAPGRFGVDRTPPEIVYHDPPAGGSTAWFGSRPGQFIDIDFRAGDGSPLDHARYSVSSNGAWCPVFTDIHLEHFTSDWSVDWGQAMEGGDPVSIAVADAAGNISVHSYVAGISGFLFRKDVTPPDVACPPHITQASDGHGCTASVVLQEAAAWDNLDLHPTVSNNAPPIFQAGTTLVTWTATDHAGNRASCQQEVTINEHVPPTLSFSDPSPECTNHPPCFAELHFADNCGLDAGWFRMDRGPWIPMFASCAGVSWSSDTWCVPESLFSSLPEGGHDIWFKAVDDEGNSAGQSGQWQSLIHKDVSPPLGPANVCSPSHVPHRWSNRPQVRLTWTDAGDGTQGCGLQGYAMLWSANSADVPARDTSISFVPAGLGVVEQTRGEGVHYIHLRSVDLAGNWQSESDVTHHGPFRIDMTPPTCTITQHPVGRTAVCDEIELCFAGQDNSSPNDSLTFSHLLVGVDSKPSEWSPARCTSRQIAEGSHLFWVWAQDLAGNRSPAAECVIEASSAYYVKGDVTADCHIDILDVARCTAIILESRHTVAEAESCRADCCQDGLVNILDALWIVNTILGVDGPLVQQPRSPEQGE